MRVSRNNVGKIGESDPEEVLHGKEFDSSLFVHGDESPEVGVQRRRLLGLGQHATCDTPD